jgi:hypothetical protein
LEQITKETDINSFFLKSKKINKKKKKRKKERKKEKGKNKIK